MSTDPLYEYLVQVAEWRRSCRKGSDWKYSCIEDYVIKNGIVFNSVELTKDEVSIIRRAARKRIFPIQQCFKNSQILVSADDTNTLTYVEGYALGVIPVHHAWVMINNKVVDLTMRVYEINNGCIDHSVRLHNYNMFQDCVLGVLPAGRSYIGAPFDKDEVLVHTLKTKMYSSLIDDWQGGWKKLRGE